MKKIIAMLLLASFVLVGTVGCGDTPKPPEKKAEKKEDDAAKKTP